MYDTSHCLEFKTYIQVSFKNRFDNGELITAEALMAGAMTKSIALCDGNQWVKEDENKCSIIALVVTLKNAGTSLNGKNKQFYYRLICTL